MIYFQNPHTWIKCLAVATKQRVNTDCVQTLCCLMFSQTNPTFTIQAFWDVTLWFKKSWTCSGQWRQTAWAQVWLHLFLPKIAVTSQSAHLQEEKYILSPLEIKPQTVQPTALSLCQLNYAYNVTLCQMVSSYCCFREAWWPIFSTEWSKKTASPWRWRHHTPQQRQ